MKIIKFIFLLLLPSLFMMSLNAQELGDENIDGNINDDISKDLKLLGGDFRIAVNGELNVNHDSSNRLNLKESFVSLDMNYKDKIRAVITAKLEHALNFNGSDFNHNFELAEFIKEAYIEIREIGGTPVALVVGKQPVSFGQNVQTMPIFSNNPMGNLQKIDQVFGFTVDMTEGLFGVFDRAELSVFETEANDFQIGKIDGVSIRLSKMLTNQIMLTASHASLGNTHLNSGSEKRTSVGLIGESDDGFLVGWIEGIYFSNNPEYKNSHIGITTGVMMRVTETTDVVVEYTWIEKELSEIAIGAKLALTRNLSFGPEIRYRDGKNGNPDQVIIGVSATYKFGTSGANRNIQYLFDND